MKFINKINSLKDLNIEEKVIEIPIFSAEYNLPIDKIDSLETITPGYYTIIDNPSNINFADMMYGETPSEDFVCFGMMVSKSLIKDTEGGFDVMLSGKIIDKSTKELLPTDFTADDMVVVMMKMDNQEES